MLRAVSKRTCINKAIYTQAENEFYSHISCIVPLEKYPPRAQGGYIFFTAGSICFLSALQDGRTCFSQLKQEKILHLSPALAVKLRQFFSFIYYIAIFLATFLIACVISLRSHGMQPIKLMYLHKI